MLSHFHHVRKVNALLLTAFVVLFSSCYSYRVATQAQAGTETTKTITAHSLFWGLVKKPTEIHTPLCDSLQINGLAEVTVKSNFGYSLITVLTLGIWSPMKLEWKCGKPCKKSGEL